MHQYHEPLDFVSREPSFTPPKGERERALVAAVLAAPEGHSHSSKKCIALEAKKLFGPSHDANVGDFEPALRQKQQKLHERNRVTSSPQNPSFTQNCCTKVAACQCRNLEEKPAKKGRPNATPFLRFAKIHQPCCI